jgi:hypothetical protein
MSRYLKAGALLLAGILIGLIIQFGVSSALAQTPIPNFVRGQHMFNGGMPGHMGGPMGHMGGPRGHRGGMGEHHGIIDRDAMHAKMAEAFGLTVEEFEAALAEGKKPHQLAEELGIDFAQVQETMKAAHAEALAEAVANGAITQEEADRIQAHHEQMGGHGMRGHGMGKNCPAMPATPTEDESQGS